MPDNNSPTGGELSSSDIADLADVSSSAVSNWRKRHHDFPEPLDRPGRWLRFGADEVRAWLKAHNKLPGSSSAPIEAKDTVHLLWEYMGRARGTLNPLESLLAAGEFAASLVNPTIEYVLNEVAKHTVELPKQRPWAPEGDLGFRPDSYKDVADALSTVSGMLAAAGPNAGQWSTRTELAEFIAAAVTEFQDLDEEDREFGLWGGDKCIYDPCAGTGRILLEVAKDQKPLKIFAQEIDRNAAKVASLMMSLAHYTEDDMSVAVGNSIIDDKWPELKADLVVAQPPLGVRLPDGLQDDPRWMLGNPGRDGTWAWIQIALSKLTENGRAAVVVEPGWAFKGGPARDLRAALVRQNLLDGVIALPPGSISGTSVGGLLVLLAKDRATRQVPRQPGEVLFVDFDSRKSDSSDVGRTATWLIKHCFANWRDHNSAVPEFPGSFDSLERIGADFIDDMANAVEGGPAGFPARFTALNQRVAEHNSHPDTPREIAQDIALTWLTMFFYSSVGTYQDIVDNDFNLTPRRYLTLLNKFAGVSYTSLGSETFAQQSSDASSAAEKATASAKSATDAMKPVAAFYKGLKPSGAPELQLTSLGDLEGEKQIELIIGRGAGRRTKDNPPPGDMPALLTTGWVQEASKGAAPEVQTLVTKTTKVSPESLIKPGDVIFSVSADSGPQAALVASENERGAALGFGLYAIRISGNNSGLTPSFVASWCRTNHLSQQIHRFKVGEAQPRIRGSDLRKIAIPLPADASSSDWFTNQVELHKALREAHQDLSDFVEMLPNLETGFLDSLIALVESGRQE